ncbi:MAG: SGNH/GDSL hydrolase family protein [Actinobacteria bacterium]|nr:SGNH/GDSL hydrolase family protein [Actinomycetota bacterium]
MRCKRRIASVLTVFVVFATNSTAQAQETNPRTYVALGDSFTAGPQIPDQVADPPGCGRSTRNYPSLVSAHLDYAEFVDVSCSGAGTKALTGPQTVAGGVNPPQLDAVTVDVDLVTLGIGGNDIGFSQLAIECVSLVPLGSPCQNRLITQGSDAISARIARTAPEISSVLQEIRRRAPAATVVVVGYPSILPEAYGGCWPLMPYAPSDVNYLRNKPGTERNAQAAGGRQRSRLRRP